MSTTPSDSGNKNKENILKKLLETQDAYILELEEKCKFLSGQVLDLPHQKQESQGWIGSENIRFTDLK